MASGRMSFRRGRLSNRRIREQIRAQGLRAQAQAKGQGARRQGGFRAPAPSGDIRIRKGNKTLVIPNQLIRARQKSFGRANLGQLFNSVRNKPPRRARLNDFQKAQQQRRTQVRQNRQKRIQELIQLAQRRGGGFRSSQGSLAANIRGLLRGSLFPGRELVSDKRRGGSRFRGRILKRSKPQFRRPTRSVLTRGFGRQARGPRRVR